MNKNYTPEEERKEAELFATEVEELRLVGQDLRPILVNTYMKYIHYATVSINPTTLQLHDTIKNLETNLTKLQLAFNQLIIMLKLTYFPLERRTFDKELDKVENLLK